MSGAPAPFPAWEQLGAAPAVAGVMRRYLEQVACVLRPRSVENRVLFLGMGWDGATMTTYSGGHRNHFCEQVAPSDVLHLRIRNTTTS